MEGEIDFYRDQIEQWAEQVCDLDEEAETEPPKSGSDVLAGASERGFL